MQQLLLLSPTGAEASSLAQRVTHALPIRAVGYRLLPYTLAGQPRGEMLHLLATPDPVANDVPCTLRLDRTRILDIPDVWTELAAPALRRCLPRHAPILMDRLTDAALSSAAFSQAAAACFQGECPVLALAPEQLFPRILPLLGDAAPLIFHWDATQEQSLSEQLLEELALRL